MNRDGDIPTEVPLAQVQVPLILRLDARAQVAAHLLRPHCERGVELVPSKPNASILSFDARTVDALARPTARMQLKRRRRP